METQEQKGYKLRLKNRIFACLGEREKSGDWLSILDSILLELEGIPEGNRGIDFYTIYYKLSVCRYLAYKYFRKNIFDVLQLIDRGVDFNE